MIETIKIGILSDTHLTGPTELFRKQVRACFSNVDMILHAGDLTAISVLAVFDGLEVHAVHGNMCEYAAYAALPDKKIIKAGSFTIGLTHGSYQGHNLEESLRNEFASVDCIVFGHTHKPVCLKKGPFLFINPGNFAVRTRYGGPGSYAILEVNKELNAHIYSIRPI